MPSLRGNALRDYLKGRSVGVVGLGRSGIASARALLACRAKVFVSEVAPKKEAFPKLPAFLKKQSIEFGCHSEALLKQELLIVSPGVEWNLPVLKRARQKGIPVWSEIEFGYRLNPFKSIVGITGTNGKTTTTSLIGDIFKRAGRKSVVAGNIGKPITEFYNADMKKTDLICEVSSYQLEGVETFRAEAAIVLNLTPDHLHRHKTMEAYMEAKQKIFSNQGKEHAAILNFDDPWCRKMAQGLKSRVLWFSTSGKAVKGVYFQGGGITAELSHGKKIKFGLPKNILGMHNVENACAAIAAALTANIPAKAIQNSLDNFPGVPHRCEKVAVIKGVTFINDSKGTNVDSTLKALDSFNGPLHLILGGEDKGSPYSPLIPSLRDKVKQIYLIGEASPVIKKELAGVVPMADCKVLKNAVRETFKNARAGEIVLLSPACASFDQFKNFEDRGDQYKTFVRGLKS